MYNNFIEKYKKNKKFLEDNCIYNEKDEHSSCGVGLIASLDGSETREIVELGVQALRVLYHRGAVDADGKTGDGAGIQLSIPKDFFIEKIERTGHKPNDYPFGVGMIFLPRTDFAAQENARTIVESEIIREGLKIYGWRHVPINSSIIGDKAKATRPEIEQILISNEKISSNFLKKTFSTNEIFLIISLFEWPLSFQRGTIELQTPSPLIRE